MTRVTIVKNDYCTPQGHNEQYLVTIGTGIHKKHKVFDSKEEVDKFITEIKGETWKKDK